MRGGAHALRANRRPSSTCPPFPSPRLPPAAPAASPAMDVDRLKLAALLEPLPSSDVSGSTWASVADAAFAVDSAGPAAAAGRRPRRPPARHELPALNKRRARPRPRKTQPVVAAAPLPAPPASVDGEERELSQVRSNCSVNNWAAGAPPSAALSAVQAPGRPLAGAWALTRDRGVEGGSESGGGVGGALARNGGQAGQRPARQRLARAPVGAEPA